MAINLYSLDISFEGDFPLHAKSAISSAISRNTEGRGVLDFSVSDYAETKEPGLSGVIVSFSLSYGDGVKSVTALWKDGASYDDAIDSSIENLLFYEPLLMKEDGISFIYKNNYSIKHNPEYKLGTTINAVDLNGRIRGVFEVSDSFDGYDVLKPLYKDEILPGIKVEKASSSRYAVSAASSISFDSFAVWAEYGYTELIYPFIPKLNAGWSYSENSSYVFAGIGVEGYLFLNSAFPNANFTLIERGRIGANAFLTFGIDGSFRLDSISNLFFEHRVTPCLMWRVGYAKLPGKASGISLSVGGAF